MNVYSIIATVLSVIGQFGVTYQKIWGLYVWILSNFVWIYVAVYVHRDYAQLLMYMFYMVMNSWSIHIWSKNGK
jgi:nicotinamide riboside transporter PnuC